MSHINRIRIEPENIIVDPDGIFTLNLALAGVLTLDGALVSNGVVTLEVAHLVNVTTNGDETGKSITVTGLDSRGIQTQSVISLGPAGTYQSNEAFKTITKVELDSNTLDSIFIGVSGQVVTRWIHSNSEGFPTNIALHVYFDKDTALTYTVEHTLENLSERTDKSLCRGFNLLPHEFLKDKTESADSNYCFSPGWYRLAVDSYTSGGISFYADQVT